MTTSKCTYCGEHHHYTHEFVCDNVRTLYPLWDNKTDQKEAKQIATISLTDTIKSLNGDLIHKNTELLEERRLHRATKSELDIAKREIKQLKDKNLTLRTEIATK